MVTKISEKEWKKLDKSGVTVIDFSATWCGPCRMVAPVLEEISEELPAIRFFNVDVDENQNLASEFRITNIPALVILKDGQKQEMQVGFQPKDTLKPVFEKYCN